MPVLNEAESISDTVRRALAVPGVLEVVVVDGGSGDDTRLRAAAAGARVVESAPGRGIQMRAGVLQARGDVVLFLHADTWLEVGAWEAIRRCLADRTVVAGGFWKRFRRTPWLMLGSRPKCAIRLFVGRRIVGDMAMFVRRDALERIGGVPPMELMEDFELSRRLRGVGRLALAESTVVTSARRFERHGVIATYLRMWWVATLYRMGKPPAELRRLYG
jgi:rSAM/selenodomain-associated transferase 2